MSVPCFCAARVGCKPELPNTVGNCSVSDFVSEMLVAITSCFCGRCGKDVFFLRRGVRANNFLRNFVKGFLGECGTIVFLKARFQLPESDLKTALEHLVFQVGFLGASCCWKSMWACSRSSTRGNHRPASACRIPRLTTDLWEGPSEVSLILRWLSCSMRAGK